jgi:hypothetical protein
MRFIHFIHFMTGGFRFTTTAGENETNPSRADRVPPAGVPPIGTVFPF